jgi:hypothetical protein
MRIYWFNPETGVYLGEDFADLLPKRRGEYALPPDATTIPPTEVKRGEVPVFHPDIGKWEVRKLDQEMRRMRYTLSNSMSY